MASRRCNNQSYEITSRWCCGQFFCIHVKLHSMAFVRTSLCQWPEARQKFYVLFERGNWFLENAYRYYVNELMAHMDYLMVIILSLCYILVFSAIWAPFHRTPLMVWWNTFAVSTYAVASFVWIWVNYVDICILVIVATTYHTGGVTFNTNK